jgi:hypothetical protein
LIIAAVSKWLRQSEKTCGAIQMQDGRKRFGEWISKNLQDHQFSGFKEGQLIN